METRVNKSEQKQACLAMMHGDAHVDTNTYSGKSRLDIYHNVKNTDFLEWKAGVLGGLTRVTVAPKIDARPLKLGGVREGLRLQTSFTRYFYDLSVAPTKFVVKQLVKPLALSVLWQDDGTVCWCSKGYYSTAYLCTDSWDRQFVKDFLVAFNNQYGWQPTLMDYACRGKTYPRLRFKKREWEKLSEVVKSYVVPSMKYKIVS